jgi:hypothetical protein
MAVQSKRFSLNRADLVKVGKNALIFFAPALILALTALQQDASLEEILWIIRLWVLNTAVDLLRKLVAGKK